MNDREVPSWSEVEVALDAIMENNRSSPIFQWALLTIRDHWYGRHGQWGKKEQIAVANAILSCTDDTHQIEYDDVIAFLEANDFFECIDTLGWLYEAAGGNVVEASDIVKNVSPNTVLEFAEVTSTIMDSGTIIITGQDQDGTWIREEVPIYNSEGQSHCWTIADDSISDLHDDAWWVLLGDLGICGGCFNPSDDLIQSRVFSSDPRMLCIACRGGDFTVVNDGGITIGEGSSFVLSAERTFNAGDPVYIPSFSIDE
jgi:hypothetical protein